MRLWTIQPIEVWEEMNRLGYYVCNPKKAIYNKVYHKTSWSIFDLFKGDFLLHVALLFLTAGIGNVILLIYRHKQKTRQND